MRCDLASWDPWAHVLAVSALLVIGGCESASVKGDSAPGPSPQTTSPTTTTSPNPTPAAPASPPTATPLALSCSLAYFPEAGISPSNTTGQLTLTEASPTARAAFLHLTLDAELNAHVGGDVATLTLTVPESGSRHQLPFSRTAGGNSGLIYVRDPASSAELQFGCSLAGAGAVAPKPGATSVRCDVTERSSPGGAIETTKTVVLEAPPNANVGPQSSFSLRGGTFWGILDLSTEEGGMLSVNVDWTVGGPQPQHGISQLLQFGSSGETKLATNSLAGSMTGTAAILTPAGTEISYSCSVP